jgi:hypothetical protein
LLFDISPSGRDPTLTTGHLFQGLDAGMTKYQVLDDKQRAYCLMVGVGKLELNTESRIFCVHPLNPEPLTMVWFWIL